MRGWGGDVSINFQSCSVSS